MLEVHFTVEVQAGLQLGNHLRRTGKGIVDVVAGFKVAGIVGKLPPPELGDFIEFASFCFNFFGDGADEFIDGSFE